MWSAGSQGDRGGGPGYSGLCWTFFGVRGNFGHGGIFSGTGSYSNGGGCTGATGEVMVATVAVVLITGVGVVMVVKDSNMKFWLLCWWWAL